MVEISRGALFGKLNQLAYQGIDSATVFSKLRGNPRVELAHWVYQILQLQDSDLHRVLRQFSCDPSRVAQGLTEAIDRLPRGASTVDLSADVEEAVERAWVYATLLFEESQVRTGHLIVGILNSRPLRNVFLQISRELEKIKLEALTDGFSQIVSGSPEEAMTASDGTRLGRGAAPGETSGAVPSAQLGKQEALKQFTVDLTEQARQGKIDPIVGRDEEVRQVVDILMRRRQNNPLLTGEAGVGKTAVVEGFALRIAAGDVPPPLQEVTLRTLDVGLLQAGASMKGEFENRLRQVIDEVQASPKPIILFIDEAHTLVGAGGAAGTGDAANLLKPALARGNLRTIGATTWAEYKKYIEKDPALTRRFQVVQVDEPDETKAVLMMRGVAATMERHHRVQILDEALEAAVKLSHRYIPARQLPDKSVSLLDTACARVAISLHAVPGEVDDTRKRIVALETELAIIGRERAIGIDVTERDNAASGKLNAEKANLAQLEVAWREEKKLVDRILEIRARLRGTGASGDGGTAQESASNAPLSAEERTRLLGELNILQSQLAQVQGEQPLLLPSVDYQAVASVVADWTGIPVGRMARNELETVMRLADVLSQRVIGQRHAHEMIARRVQTSRAGLDNPTKPMGVFMLAGPSGVGKTETALALAEALYGGEQNVVTINMSEFQEAHTVSTLKGAPPGYVGYGEGGVLTEAVRRKPYSVVLLDEVEKAHPDVHEIFFQVFDKGLMEDGEGRLIDFKNTLILLTTNVASDLIMRMCYDPQRLPEPDDIAKAMRPELLKVFPAALLGRIVTIPFLPLSDAMMAEIIRLQLGRIEKRIVQNHRVPFTYTDAVLKLVAGRCTELESGGRMIDAILTNTLLPRVSREILTRLMEGRAPVRVAIDVEAGEFSYAFD